MHSEDRFESKTSLICDWSEYNWRHHNLMCGLFFQLQQILSETHTILDNLSKLVLFGLSQLFANISCTYLFLQRVILHIFDPVCITLQDEIIPHLEPGRVPSTVDPDTTDPMERIKTHPKRPVRISAWKLAKLDSNEAMKAAAKARASSSVLKPINTRNQYEADSDNLSTRSSVISADTGHHRYPRSCGNSQYKPSYPPSRASADDIELYPQTPSSFQSNSRTPTPLAEHHPSKHFNPIYQTSANRSPFSAKASVSEAPVSEITNAGRSYPPPRADRSSRSSVYWDQEAGRFVSAQANQGYTGQSIFFGGPLIADPAARSFRDPGGSSQRSTGPRPHQLPVFYPSDPQKDQLSRLPWNTTISIFLD